MARGDIKILAEKIEFWKATDVDYLEIGRQTRAYECSRGMACVVVVNRFWREIRIFQKLPTLNERWRRSWKRSAGKFEFKKWLTLAEKRERACECSR